jgi:hypothetical protein
MSYSNGRDHCSAAHFIEGPENLQGTAECQKESNVAATSDGTVGGDEEGSKVTEPLKIG